MDQVIQNKIFNAKSEIAEADQAANNWMYNGAWGGLRNRIHFGSMIVASVIGFILGTIFMNGFENLMAAGAAASAAFFLVGTALTAVDDSFGAHTAHYNLIEARKALIEDALDARVHKGYVNSSGTWNEFTIERDDVFEKIMVRIVENGETETVETKDFVNA